MNPALMHDRAAFAQTDPLIIMESVVVVIKEFDEQAAKLKRTKARNPNHAAFLNREAHGYASAAEQGRRFLTYLSQRVVRTPSHEVQV